jgi:hypothetical protein
MDIRRRVAGQIAEAQGWAPSWVSMWVIVAPSRTNARILADHRTVLRAKFPADGRPMRRWMARPSGEIAGLSFLPQVRVPGTWARTDDAEACPKQLRDRRRAWLRSDETSTAPDRRDVP